MGQNASSVANIASEFGRISGQAAAQGNANRARIAAANIAAGEVQQDLALRQERSRLATAFARHQGTLAVNAAFRGGTAGDADTRSALNSATIRAANEGSIAVANREAQRAALIANNQVVEEDVGLAAIEGGLRGLNVAMEIAGALQAATEVREVQKTRTFDAGAFNFGFENINQTIASTPGLDFSNLGSFFDFSLET